MYVVCSVSYPILKPLIMSFCTQGLPRVAESTDQLAKEYLFPGEEMPASADEGGKVFYLALTHRLRRPPFPEGRGMLDDGFCDFTFGSAQNDRMGGL